MSRLKIPRPPKYVLVRTTVSDELYVLERKWFVSEQAKGVHVDAEVVAESDDKAELERFRNLTEES